MDMDAFIAQFTSLTHSDVDTASHYYELTNGQLQDAIELYLISNDESPPIDSPSISHESHSVPSTSYESHSIQSAQSFDPYSISISRNATFDTSDSLIFPPPTSLLFSGDLNAARSHALANSTFILIHYLDPSHFYSQCLNRDYWNYPQLASLISTHFTFIQLISTTSSAQEYSQFYPLTALPHVSILHPMTMERLVVFDGLIENNGCFGFGNDSFVDSFATRLSNWLSVHKPSAVSSVSASAISELSEEEQLKLALEASVASLPSTFVGREEWVASLDTLDIADAGESTTRIQLRLPDGQRFVGVFGLDRLVSDVYRWCKLKCTLDCFDVSL